jgi:hypothetical protein
VRGGRALARQVLDDRRHTLAPPPPPRPARPKTEDRPLGLPPEAARPGPRVSSAGGGVGTESALAAGGGTPAEAPGGADGAGEGVLDDGAAVRGLLHDAQGGPLPPPGVRRREAFQAVRDARERRLCAQKGGQPRRCGRVSQAAWTAALRSQARP